MSPRTTSRNSPGEVVVERAAGHPGQRDDLLGGDVVEAPPLEQSPRRVQKGLPRRLRAFDLRPSF
jgi:hypothetical protein